MRAQFETQRWNNVIKLVRRQMLIKYGRFMLSIVAHACNVSSWEAEAGGL
jgi:hypothetical protein